jgi:hypothetical protein
MAVRTNYALKEPCSPVLASLPAQSGIWRRRVFLCPVCLFPSQIDQREVKRSSGGRIWWPQRRIGKVSGSSAADAQADRRPRMVSTPFIEFLGCQACEASGAGRTGTARSRAYGGPDVSRSALIRDTTLISRIGKANSNWKYSQTSGTIFTR